VTLTVTRNTISGQAVRRSRMRASLYHRSSLTGSGWDLRWVSGRGKTPTLCVFPLFSIAVMEKCCDVCGDGEN
jgi:hypothetical protein